MSSAFHGSSDRAYGLRDIARVLSRRRHWIVGTVIVGVLLALAVTVIMKPVYEATSTIELNKGGAGPMDISLGDILSQGSGGGSEALSIDLQTETTILESDSLALAVIQRLNLATHPDFKAPEKSGRAADPEAGLPLDQAPVTRTRLINVFRRHLKVAPVHGTRLIQISYDSHDTNEAAQIANALIESYKAQYLKSHYDATSEASDWLTKQLSDLKANVEESDKKLADFERQTGIVSLSMMGPGSSESGSSGGMIHSVVIQKLDALNADLTNAEANRIEKEAIYHMAQSKNSDALISLAASPGALPNNSMVVSQGALSTLQQLRGKRNELEMELAKAAPIYGANNRHVAQLQAQVTELDRQIQQSLQEIVKLASTDMQLAQRTEDQLRKRFDMQQAEANKLNEKTVEFAVLSQEAYSRKKLYEDLYTRLQEANVSAGIKATNITIIDPARPQSIPVLPKRSTNLGAGLAISLLAGLVLAFTVDRLDRTVSNPLEVEELTEFPVIGIIPNFSGANRNGSYYSHYGRTRTEQPVKRPQPEPDENGETPESKTIWMLDHPESQMAEAFRALRTSIMLSKPGGGPRVFLVTSCIPAEGKSTITGNLAICFAQHGKRVIVVEADMRRPTMKSVLGVSNESGLSSVLAGARRFEDAVLRGVHLPTLDVLPAGPRAPLPSELLGGVAFDQLLERLRGEYDVVIVDSPPALLITDAVAIGSKTDAMIWVARIGYVTRPHLARATQLVLRHRLPLIGFVMNRTDRKLDPFGYGYGYDYKNYGYYSEERDEDEK